MLVITGTQRSGTTMIARLFRELGYNLGSDFYDEEALGGYENELLCGFYRDYIGDPTFPFDDYPWPEEVGAGHTRYVDYSPAAFAALDMQVVKFSYLLMNPAFVHIWHKFRPEGDTFLILNRDKSDVIASKVRQWERFKHDSALLMQTKEALDHNFLSAGLYLQKLYGTATLLFPRCIQSRSSVNFALDRLTNHSIQIPYDVWNAVVDPSKVHYGAH